MRKVMSGILGILLVLFGVAGPGFADENEIADLKQQVEKLNKRISQLEGEVAKTPTYVAPGAPAEGGLLKAASEIQVSGHLDVQWSDNLNYSSSNTQGTTSQTGRIFDRYLDTFTINAAEIDLERPADDPGEVGFRIDLQFGEDAFTVNADGDTDAVNLQQAYVEYNAPLEFFEGNSFLPDNISIKAGRFVTLAGLEVIEGPDNWNISRSFMFGFSIPFAHTGVRTNFGLWGDKIDAYVGLNNGWDNPIDNNSYKTLELGAGYSPLENVSMFHTLYWGPEITNRTGQKRFLVTNVVTWDVTDKLSLMGNIDLGNQNRNLVGTDFENSQWYGFAGYARYQVNDKFAVATRLELFRDTEEFRTGLDRTLSEYTLTGEYAITDNMLVRAEYRFDKADNDGVFAGDSSQSTLGAQLLYLI